MGVVLLTLGLLSTTVFRKAVGPMRRKQELVSRLSMHFLGWDRVVLCVRRMHKRIVL